MLKQTNWESGALNIPITVTAAMKHGMTIPVRNTAEEEYGVENVKAVIKTVKRTPGIIWVSPAVWFVLSLICAISNIFFYELVIPFFERAYMTDAAFAFFDVMVLILPSVLALTFAVLNKIFVI